MLYCKSWSLVHVRPTNPLDQHHRLRHCDSDSDTHVVKWAEIPVFSVTQPSQPGGETEMANQGTKKRKEENARHMARLLQIIIIACNVLYVLVRMLVFHSTLTWKHWIGLVVTSLAYVIPYQQLAKMAHPTYADDGELIDGRFDMSTGGICGYLHDVIYITCFVQVASIISDKFWYIYLVIPAFGAYQSFGFIKGFLPRGSEESYEDEKTRKKREKMEKRASRTKFVKTGTR